MVGLLRSAAVLAALGWGSAVYAQQVQSSPVLTLDQDRLFTDSLFGQRVQSDLQAQSQALSQENRKIEAALEEEESRLTGERAEMDPAAFAELARDFDERVTGIRQAQASKSESIRRTSDAERSRFFEAAFPILLQLVEETGAVAILANSAVIFSTRQIDITDIAIARVDAAIGASPLPVDPGPAPLPRPDPNATAPDDATTDPDFQTTDE